MRPSTTQGGSAGRFTIALATLTHTHTHTHTHKRKDFFRALVAPQKEEIFFSLPQREKVHLLFTSLGVSLYCSITILSLNANGNFMSISLTTMHKDLLLVNVYGPNRDSPECYDKL